MLDTLPYRIHERTRSSLHPLWRVLWTSMYDPYMQWYRRITRCFMTPPLHRGDIRYHTIAGYYSDFGKLESCVYKVFCKFELIDYVFITVWLVLLDLCPG